MHIDNVSGIPIYHLTFIMNSILPLEMFRYLKFAMGPIFTIREINFHYLGSIASNTNGEFQDVTFIQKIKREEKSGSAKIVILKSGLEATHTRELVNRDGRQNKILVDCSKSMPGYCRLRLLSKSATEKDGNFISIDSHLFLKPFKIPEDLELHAVLKESAHGEIQCIGVRCPSFPFPHRWTDTSGRNTFPSKTLIDSILRLGCTLIPKSHPNSDFPDIEWKFNFSMAEFLIFESFSTEQMHGFHVLKLLIQSFTHHIPFKESHMRNIFLISWEEIPSTSWETNFSGCVLYVLDAFLSCLKAKFLPNYFMQSSNLIDYFREDDINNLITNVEFIRQFPAYAIQIVAEKKGFTHAPNLIKSVLLDVDAFIASPISQKTFENLFLPLTIATVKILARMGFYQVSYRMLERSFEQSILIPQEGPRRTSVSFINLFNKAVLAMKQASSRFILSEMLDQRTGSNLLDDFKAPVLSLQDCLEWTVDYRLNWIEVPPEICGDLVAISSFLYEHSIQEYWRRNKILAELTITLAIRCIKEMLKHASKVVKKDDSRPGLNADVKIATTRSKLFEYYKHMYYVSMLDFLVQPLIDYMNDIETLCEGFPERTGIVSDMFAYVKMPDKSEQYAKMFAAHIFGWGKGIFIY